MQEELLQLARDKFDVFYELNMADKLGKSYTKLPKFQEYICQKLQWYNEQVELKNSPRLILCMPPRYSKTETSSINFPLWVLGNHPKRRFALVTYGATLSEKTGQKARDLLSTDLYQTIFPNVKVRSDTKSKTDWQITEGGHYFATTVSASLTGIGLTDLIVDDPYKSREEAESKIAQESAWEWFQSTAQSRMEDGGGIIIIMQRWNDNDLVQKVLDQQKDLEEQGLPFHKWEMINFPVVIDNEEDEQNDVLGRKIGDVLWGEKYNKDTIDLIRSTSNPYYFNSQYQQKPTAQEAQVFKKEMIQYFNEEMQYEKTYTSLDPAVSQRKEADRSAIVTIGVKDKKAYVLETTASQFNSNDVLMHLFRHQKQYNSEVLVETVASQKLWLKLINDKMIDDKQFFKLKDVKQLSNKETRIFSTVMPYLSENRLFFRQNQTDLIQELLTFPRGRRDDILDSLCQALGNIEFKNKVKLQAFGNEKVVNHLIRRF